MSDVQNIAPGKLNIIVADDHQLFCKAMADLISTVNNINSVKQAYNGREVLAFLDKELCDIIFMDIDMPVLNGIETLKEIRRRNIEIPVVAVSMHCNVEYYIEMQANKINGYILKNTSIEEIVRSITLLMEGGEYYSPEIIQELRKSTYLNEDMSLKNLDYNVEITDREIEILKLICLQLTAKEIADKLNISEKTVKRHKENLLEKTCSINQVGLAIYAIKKGIKIF